MLCKQPFKDFGCGQCLPCRINMRRIWSSRIMLEASLHGDTSFLTLTYDDDHLPKNSSLQPKDLQLFWKRLRKSLDAPIRYYAVGEYGDQTQRPHYHAALFGFACSGKMQRLETGLRCYCQRCELIYSTWQLGNVTVDELNDTTSAYIAGYVVKKMTSKDDHRLNGRYPEFSRMSQGIGRGAIGTISQALQSEYGHLAYKFGDVPAALNRGNSRVPLGRYLRTKLRQDIGLEKIHPETGEVTYGTPSSSLIAYKALSSPEVHNVSEAIRNAPPGEKKNLYEKLDNARVVDASKRQQRILNMEAKHSILNSKKEKSL